MKRFDKFHTWSIRLYDGCEFMRDLLTVKEARKTYGKRAAIDVKRKVITMH